MRLNANWTAMEPNRQSPLGDDLHIAYLICFRALRHWAAVHMSSRSFGTAVFALWPSQQRNLPLSRTDVNLACVQNARLENGSQTCMSQILSSIAGSPNHVVNSFVPYCFTSLPTGATLKKSDILTSWSLSSASGQSTLIPSPSR